MPIWKKGGNQGWVALSFFPGRRSFLSQFQIGGEDYSFLEIVTLANVWRARMLLQPNQLKIGLLCFRNSLFLLLLFLLFPIPNQRILVQEKGEEEERNREYTARLQSILSSLSGSIWEG